MFEWIVLYFVLVGCKTDSVDFRGLFMYARDEVSLTVDLVGDLSVVLRLCVYYQVD
jgi:hypothetical protein